MPSVEWKGSAHSYRESQIPRLTDAEERGQYVKVTCTWCSPNVTRYYRPMDIYKLTGQRHVLQLQRRFRCEACGRKDYMEVSFKTVIGQEIKGLVVRELVEIRMVKRPIWRDRKL